MIVKNKKIKAVAIVVIKLQDLLVRSLESANGHNKINSAKSKKQMPKCIMYLKYMKNE